MINFLANENIPLQTIVHLRNSGCAVKSVLEEMPGARDHEIVKRAHDEKLIILTFDRDYGELIYRHQHLSPDGVVYFRFDPATPTEPAEIILNIIKDNIPLSSRFTVVERDGIRQRPLPLP